MDDEEALDRVMNPARNRYRLDMLNVSYHSPLMRALHHATYVFEKRLSHTADSQDQRHRMVPASRPLMTFADTAQPDYITPRLIAANPRAKAVYDAAMQEAWDAKNQLLDLDVPLEHALYVLPNAKTLRFVESGSLLALLHKWTLRTCFNAQEEIYLASMDEIEQVRAAASADRPLHRPAVRHSQRPDLAAMHRGIAFLRRPRLARFPERGSTTVGMQLVTFRMQNSEFETVSLISLTFVISAFCVRIRITVLGVIAAWLVHAYTASGLVLALLAARAVIDFDYRAAFFWLWLQVLIDATDGLLARRARVAERIPWFDGGKLDDIVDYLTYVFVPALFVWRACWCPTPGRCPWRPRCSLERIRLQPKRREDGRSLLHGIPVVLECRGVLSARRGMAVAGECRRAAGVRAAGLHPSSLRLSIPNADPAAVHERASAASGRR